MPHQSIDVGHALELMLYDDNTAGQTYELNGPKEYALYEIAEMVDREIFKKRTHFNVPKAILKPVAGLINKLLWWDVMSADEIEREFLDQQYDETAKTFKDLGIEPGDISKFTYHYLVSAPCLSEYLLRAALTPLTARIPQQQLLRPPAGDGEGEEGREEVPARRRRALSHFFLCCGRARSLGLLVDYLEVDRRRDVNSRNRQRRVLPAVVRVQL